MSIEEVVMINNICENVCDNVSTTTSLDVIADITDIFDNASVDNDESGNEGNESTDEDESLKLAEECGENPILLKPDYQGVKKSKLINKSINDYVEEFISSIVIDGKTDNLSILKEWQSKDNQFQLNGYIHQNKMKMKKKVDVGEPKKISNEFTYFSREMRKMIKADNPDADAEIIPMIAKLWQDVKNDEEEMKRYREMVMEDKKRYEDELNRYKMITQREDKKKKEEKRLTRIKEKSEKKKLKEQEKPKSAYYFFIKDEKPKIVLNKEEMNRKDSRKEIHVELQKRWKELKVNNPILMNTYMKVAEENAKVIPVVEKKYRKNEVKVSKYDKNKERNKKREEERK